MILQRAIEQVVGIDSAKVAEVLNATDVTTFYGQTKFSTTANEHGIAGGLNPWFWRNGRRTSPASWSKRWCGRWPPAAEVGVTSEV
jgi:hypothetical protein